MTQSSNLSLIRIEPLDIRNIDPFGVIPKLNYSIHFSSIINNSLSLW